MMLNLKWDEDSSRLKVIRPLQKLLGELNFIAEMSRPDFSFALNEVARETHKATLEVVRAASTRKFSRVYSGNSSRSLEFWTDNSHQTWKECNS